MTEQRGGRVSRRGPSTPKQRAWGDRGFSTRTPTVEDRARRNAALRQAREDMQDTIASIDAGPY